MATYIELAVFTLFNFVINTVSLVLHDRYIKQHINKAIDKVEASVKDQIKGKNGEGKNE